MTLLFPVVSISEATEQIIVRIVLNQEEKGDFFVTLQEDGDFLLETDDLEKIGLELPPAETKGQRQRSLRAIDGIDYVFDLSTLSIEISAEPDLLGRKIIDFRQKRTEKVYYPSDTSLFINYNVESRAGNNFDFSSFDFTSEIGMRTGQLLFLTNGVYTVNQSEDRFTRLQSRFTYDDRNIQRRFIVGDFFANSGDLGSSLNMGGVSLRKVYHMKPNYVYYPTLNFIGQTELPTEAKIYLNGMLLRTEQLSPGEFELKNLTPYGAAGAIDVVLKDAFGREQRLYYPFYYADKALLKEGFHEYSYNLGFLRERYGQLSNRYGRPAFSVFHRYGVNDDFTLGLHAEVSDDLVNLGPEMSFLAGNAGICSLFLSGSMETDSGSGVAGIATYSYQGLSIGFNLSLAGYTRNYRTAADSDSDDRPKFSASTSVSYGNRRLGTLSLDLSSVRRYFGVDRDQGGVSYTRSITPQVSLTTSYRRIREQNDRDELLFTLNYTPKNNIFASSRYEQTENRTDMVFSLQKNPSVGEGFSYRASINRSESRGVEAWRVNPYLRYNGRYALYEGSFEERFAENRRESIYRLSIAGALVSVGEVFGATRPVYDSFGLVHIGDLEGVKVLLNSQEVGVTNDSGNLFVPNLGSFTENQLEIDSANIPINYYLSEVKKYVSPPLRSGSCIPFVAQRMQPVFGRLAMRVDGELKPLEFLEVTCNINGRAFVFPTGSGGEFDIDPTQSDVFRDILEAGETGCSSDTGDGILTEGTFQASIIHEGRKLLFPLTIPESDDPFIDIGQVVIE